MRNFILVLFSLMLITIKVMSTNPVKSKIDTISKSSSFLDYEKQYDLRLINLQMDIHGFLWYGPQIFFDLQFVNMIAFGPYVHWLYAGLVSNSFSGTSSLTDYSIGVQAKFLAPLNSGENRPYIEVGIEKAFLDNEMNDFQIDKVSAYHINIGIRKMTQSQFNISFACGILRYYSIAEKGVAPMFHVILGWQLGK